jgi:hypothetical protein
MNMQRDFLLFVTLAAAAATPALGQTVTPAVEPANGGTQGAASIPDFSGIWWHPSLPGFEPPASGPGPVTNRSRRNGVSNYDQLVGDYTNPILKPETAEIVKKFGELSLRGVTFPSPANQCWPEPVPYIYKNFAMQILQQPDRITIIYEQDHEVRHVRMNQPHPPHVTPSWYGDSVAHYEGDMLVIDTIGVKIGPYAMVDWYGTPHGPALHVVERYRLMDYAAAKEGLERNAKENFIPDFDRPPSESSKYLQLYFTVEDPAVFTTPWSATVTYERVSPLANGDSDTGEWDEEVCAENLNKFGTEKSPTVPTAAKPDF